MGRYNQICLSDRIYTGFRLAKIESDLCEHLAYVLPRRPGTDPIPTLKPAATDAFQIAQYLRHLKAKPAIK